MLDYSQYYAAMIALAQSGNAFIYWMTNRLTALDGLNYGRGKSHWIEFLGKYTREECRDQYRGTPILPADDKRINEFIRSRIKEMDDLVQE